MKKWIALIALLTTASIITPAFSHGPRINYGGVVQSAGGLQFELVSKGGAGVLYIQNHGGKVPTAGLTGTLTVTNGSAKTEVPLQPMGENALETKGNANLTAGAKAVATITFPDKRNIEVSFLIK